MNIETVYAVGFLSGMCIMLMIMYSIYGPLMKLNNKELKALKKGVEKCESQFTHR